MDYNKKHPVRQVGGSLAVVLTHPFKLLHICEGNQVRIIVKDSKIIIQKENGAER